MLQQYMESLDGMVTYQIVSLVFFLAACCAVVLWTVKLRKDDVEKMSRLPLDSSERPQQQSTEVRS